MINTAYKMLESNGSNGKRKASSVRGNQGSVGWKISHNFK